MSEISHADALTEAFALAVGLSGRTVEFTGSGTLSSAFAVGELAAASVAVAGLAVAQLLESTGVEAPRVTVDRGLACAWFGTALTPVGWELPSPWDALAGDYRAADGWIRLHTNAPHHRAAALAVLGVEPDRERVAAAVGAWAGENLELAVIEAGGCAAVMRTAGEWSRHPQGTAVGAEPIVAWGAAQPATPSGHWRPMIERPLAGLRVLDLTRVLAGPVATRFLAGLGADVLRVDPPGWDEPAVVPDMTLGKRSARIDASTTEGRGALERLIAGADVLVSGYRPGALEKLVPAERRAVLRPGLLEFALDAYGWHGPWSGRRGFDSLVQMSSGIAEAGMRWAGTDRPTPLPVQALDHATGYLLAAAVLRGLTRLRTEGAAVPARLSLARMAAVLLATPATAGEVAVALPRTRIATPWGPSELLEPPVRVGETRLDWPRGPTALGSDEPRF